MNAEQQWEIDRYILGDSAFDRDAFEARMFGDEQLALAVADEVERLQLLRQALELRSGVVTPAVTHATSGQAAVPRRQRLRSRTVPVAGLVMAAAVLLAVAVWRPWQSGSSMDGLSWQASEHRASAEDASLEQIAEQWLAIEDVVVEDTMVEGQSDDFGLTQSVPFDAWAAEEATNEDWVMDASDFFLGADT